MHENDSYTDVAEHNSRQPATRIAAAANGVPSVLQSVLRDGFYGRREQILEAPPRYPILDAHGEAGAVVVGGSVVNLTLSRAVTLTRHQVWHLIAILRTAEKEMGS